MTQENNSVNRSDKKKTNNKKFSTPKIILLSLLILSLIGTGVLGGLVVGAIKGTEPINENSLDDLVQNSFLLTQDGNEIDKFGRENRTPISLEDIPDHLQKAFISIEDERFYKHNGIDIKGIMAALVEDIKAMAKVRGASTITQQLIKNRFLTNEKKITRKIKEAYMAMKLERQFSKDQILEAYLNEIFLGQDAYGIKSAAYTYFSKEDLNDLTIAQSALIAGITQNPSKLSPYITMKPQDVPEGRTVLGDVNLGGEVYSMVFNERSIERQRLVLAKMKDLGHISEVEYNEALTEDIKSALKPAREKKTELSSYFGDFVRKQVVDDLVSKAGLTPEEAQQELFTGGLRIYSTVDVALQKDIENMYREFSNIVLGGRSGSKWTSDRNGNIINPNSNINSRNRIAYYKKSNFLNDEGDLIIENGTYTLTDDTLTIKNSKVKPNSDRVNLGNYYTLHNGILIAHNPSALSLNKEDFLVDGNNDLVIKSSFFNSKPDFFRIDEANNLIISSTYFDSDETGIIQPQSSTVIIDHSTGQIRALVGGRNFEGSNILNRAIKPRQPGSAIKPLVSYLPALDNGYTAASPIDDSPVKKVKGRDWPRNSYGGYKGLITMREAIRISSNTTAVKMVKTFGPTAKDYLRKLGIDVDDNENLDTLGLGGMSRGISPLDMAGAYAAIANNGNYLKPISYTKIEDRYGNVILENEPKKGKVVSSSIAYVLTDMLKDVVTSGTGRSASIPGYEAAGKTGTTDDNADAWFVGYTPNLTASVWIGNDIPAAVKLTDGSRIAAQLWSRIMKRANEGAPQKSFNQPSDVIKTSICTFSGKLATSLCSNDFRYSVKTEVFAKGTEPKEYCEHPYTLKPPVPEEVEEEIEDEEEQIEEETENEDDSLGDKIGDVIDNILDPNKDKNKDKDTNKDKENVPPANPNPTPNPTPNPSPPTTQPPNPNPPATKPPSSGSGENNSEGSPPTQ